MLFSTVGQRIPAQTEAENEESPSVEQLFPQEQRKKGKQRAATEERRTSKLLALLKEMKGEIRERDEQIREELR